jgi:oligopeptide transport system substrate-binding protein
VRIRNLGKGEGQRMKERRITVRMAVLLLMTALAACGSAPASVEEAEIVPSTEAQIPPPSPATPAEPVTLDNYATAEVPTLDPQLATDVASVNYIENLFVNLTSLDPGGIELLPEAATGWQGSDDGLAYTFKLRTDIPWVRHDAETGETRQVLDSAGSPRFVTAHDFVYGIKRACDPNLGGYYSSVVAPVIKGCEAVLYAEDPANIPPELVEAIGVSAPADDTLVIELAFPASYFLSMTPMWTLAATPQWAIEQHDKAWIEPENLVTNGRYVLHEWQPGVRRILWRNPLLPQDLRGTGNIERVVTRVVPELSTGYALWLNNEVDATGIPDLELQAHLERFSDETEQEPDLSVLYFGFALDKPPFDNVHVRRAFSAAFDRQTYSDQVLQGQCLPMIHFAPPGIFGAPPIDEVGVGFDPQYAQEQLAQAGYPDCEGFPQVTLLTFEGQDSLHGAEYAQAQWEEHLGCSLELIRIEQLPFREQLAAVKAPAEARPHIWTAGWAPDYPDENNWVGDVLWCKSPENPRRRECSELDDLIVEAREEPDPERRIALYRQIEEGFFGPEGEMPIAPRCTQIGFGAVHLWLDAGPLELFSGVQWYNWTIDWEAKRAAQGH